MKLKFRQWNKQIKALVRPNLYNGRLMDGDDYILQQYTGMNDKNGVEIFVGDYYKDADFIYEVRFGEYIMCHDGIESEYWGFYVFSEIGCSPLCKSDESVIEVCGNIFTTPNLI